MPRRALYRVYGAESAPVFHVRFVRWPYPNRTQAKLRGGPIVLFSELAVEDDWAPIVLHEYAHFQSAGQPAASRETLAEEFARLCPAALALPYPLNALEETLATYWGQYRFEWEVHGKALSRDAAWYFQPMPTAPPRHLLQRFQQIARHRGLARKRFYRPPPQPASKVE